MVGDTCGSVITGEFPAVRICGEGVCGMCNGGGEGLGGVVDLKGEAGR